MLSAEQALSLGKEHQRAGRADAAEALFLQILERQPGHAETLEAMVLLMLERGRIEEATAYSRRVLVAKSNDLDAYFALGYLLHAQGALNELADVYRRALRLFPGSDEVCFRLGNVEWSTGNVDAAIDLFRRAVALRPRFWEARNHLGLTLQESGRRGDAAQELAEAARLDPDHVELHYNLGISLAALGRWNDAVAAYQQAVRLNPAYADAHNGMAAAYKALGRLDDAGAAFRAALRSRPDFAAAESNLAGVYEWQARHDEALSCHRRAMALAPDSALFHGNYLFTLLFHPGFDAAALRKEHAEWSRRHESPLKAFIRRHDNDRTPERRLRIGYVGGLFRDHVVGRNLLPLMREHDRSGFDVFCYSSNRIDDDITERFRRVSGGWREIGRMSDADTAELIRQDRIDILVDTTLHLEGSRLLAFARKPAPVQVTFAGYPGSTGLEAIDYRLTDPYLDPPGIDESLYSERTWRLPDTFWCYDPLGLATPIGPLPADRDGRITFGCLNNFSKLNARVWQLWARTLRGVPDSRLLLLAHEGGHRRTVTDFLKKQGIEPARLEFAEYRPRSAYLELFNRIDVTLDTLPYTGHTTSLDSLWMGVPVVTLTGETVVGRAGVSQLTNLELSELIASTPDEYATLAAGLAADRRRLRELRQTLRSRMERSPLMDATKFARNIESAYREMWRRWCSGNPPTGK